MDMEARTRLFLKVRQLVEEEATVPPGDSPGSACHLRNRALYRNKLRDLKAAAQLDPLLSNDEFWREAWQKIRYANRRANDATKEINRLVEQKVFADFRSLTHPSWNFDASEWCAVAESDRETYQFRHCGPAAVDLMLKRGQFDGCGFAAHPQKMARTVRLARKLAAFEHRHAGTTFLGSLMAAQRGTEEPDLIKAIYRELRPLLGPKTALHLMMDVGFAVIKPDVVVTRLFARLGWLTDLFDPADPEVDSAVAARYARSGAAETIEWRVIETAYDLKQAFPPEMEITMREIDFAFVKYGQEPEPQFGIVRNLDRETPIQELLKQLLHSAPEAQYHCATTPNGTEEVTSMEQLQPEAEGINVMHHRLCELVRSRFADQSIREQQSASRTSFFPPTGRSAFVQVFQASEGRLHFIVKSELSSEQIRTELALIAPGVSVDDVDVGNTAPINGARRIRIPAIRLQRGTLLYAYLLWLFDTSLEFVVQ